MTQDADRLPRPVRERTGRCPGRVRGGPTVAAASEGRAGASALGGRFVDVYVFFIMFKNAIL